MTGDFFNEAPLRISANNWDRPSFIAAMFGIGGGGGGGGIHGALIVDDESFSESILRLIG